MMIGMSNVKMSNDGVNWQPICDFTEAELTTPKEEVPEWLNISNTPISISATIRKRKNGSLLEKSLYYCKSKKKRIRKKWNIVRILEKGR